MVSREMALDIIDPRRKFPYLAIMSLDELRLIVDSRFWVRTEDRTSSKITSPHSSPLTKSSFIPFDAKSPLLKRTKHDDFGIENVEEEYVRAPDPVYKETLIGGSGFRDYDEIYNQQPDFEYQEAINESLRSFEEEKHKQTTETLEDLEMENIINSLSSDLPDEVSVLIDDLANFNPLLEKWKHLEIPSDFDFANLSIIDSIYDDLLKEDFNGAKKRISEITNLKHMDWIKSLSYNNISLKTMISNKNKEAHHCLK